MAAVRSFIVLSPLSNKRWSARLGERFNRTVVYYDGISLRDHMGDLATIGRHAAVVKLGRLELTGFLGWLFWSVVHIYFLIEVRDRFIVAFIWLWDYVTFQRGARLITEVPPAERK